MGEDEKGIVLDLDCIVIDLGRDFVVRSREVVLLGAVLRALGLVCVVLDY